MELGFVVFPPPLHPTPLPRGRERELAEIAEKAGADVKGFGAELGSSPCLRAQTIVPYPKVLRRAPKVT